MSEENIPVEENLEAVRDALCVPVAQGVLADLAGAMNTGEVVNNADFVTTVMKILQRSLDADLNLTTENPYIFQLVLGVFSSFSTVIQGCKVQPKDDVRFARIGREMLQLMAAANVRMGDKTTPDDQVEDLKAIQPQLETLFEREKLTWLEVKYILENILTSLKATEQIFSSNVERAVHKMEAKILGLEDMTDLTMKKLDETLKTQIEEIKNAQ